MSRGSCPLPGFGACLEYLVCVKLVLQLGLALCGLVVCSVSLLILAYSDRNSLRFVHFISSGHWLFIVLAFFFKSVCSSLVNMHRHVSWGHK